MRHQVRASATKATPSFSSPILSPSLGRDRLRRGTRRTMEYPCSCDGIDRRIDSASVGATGSGSYRVCAVTFSLCRTYLGGQVACHHMFSLLDADQLIPWVDQPLTFQLKFRFWVQPYNASYHTNVRRVTWGIASPVEYDVPKCGEGVAGCSVGPDGTWIHTIKGTFKGEGKLVAAHFHCHAPTCLSMAMYACDKGAADCTNETGTLLCREDPVYGGTGRVDDPRFDEPGYILQPPCLWGSAEYGLEPPPDVNGLMLHTVKTSNATWGHHGEMAWQQMFVC